MFSCILMIPVVLVYGLSTVKRCEKDVLLEIHICAIKMNRLTMHNTQLMTPFWFQNNSHVVLRGVEVSFLSLLF